MQPSLKSSTSPKRTRMPARSSAPSSVCLRPGARARRRTAPSMPLALCATVARGRPGGSGKLLAVRSRGVTSLGGRSAKRVGSGIGRSLQSCAATTPLAEAWLRRSRGPCCSAACDCSALRPSHLPDPGSLAAGQCLGICHPVMPPRVVMAGDPARACAASERAGVWEVRSSLHEQLSASPRQEPRCPTVLATLSLRIFALRERSIARKTASTAMLGRDVRSVDRSGGRPGGWAVARAAGGRSFFRSVGHCGAAVWWQNRACSRVSRQCMCYLDARSGGHSPPDAMRPQVVLRNLRYVDT